MSAALGLRCASVSPIALALDPPGLRNVRQGKTGNFIRWEKVIEMNTQLLQLLGELP